MTQILLFIAFIVFCVLAAVFGRRLGRAMGQAGGLAMMVLGLGAVIDPPVRHGIESVESEKDDEAGTGDSPDTPEA